MVDRDMIERARVDIDVFARELVHEPLWPHQLAIATSPARIRVVCSGRQAGKSRTLAVMALYAAFANPERRILLLSAGDDAAKDLLAECSALCLSPLLAGSVADESRSEITLSNGSTIRSVPASTRRVRGQAIDLLIIDEACFVDDDIWTAARYTIIARPGSRVVMASTPWGRADRFFATHYRAGLAGDDGTESFHWPSTVSPLVDPELLEMWRRTSTSREFRAEVEAEFVDDHGSYFTPAEVESSIVDSVLVAPDDAFNASCVAGVDWGFSPDGNALVLLRGDEQLARDRGHDDWATNPMLAVTWAEVHHQMPYAEFVELICDAGDPTKNRYQYHLIASERNGCGEGPSQLLVQRMGERGIGGQALSSTTGDGKVRRPGVATTAKSKENGYGYLKLLMQQGKLALPRIPALLLQLGNLAFEHTESGLLRIAVPERAGHDDLASALCLGANVFLDRPQLRTPGAWERAALEALTRPPPPRSIMHDIMNLEW